MWLELTFTSFREKLSGNKMGKPKESVIALGAVHSGEKQSKMLRESKKIMIN